MKKFTLLLTALLITSFSALAQIKLVVCQEGGARSEFIASSVDSIIFVGLEDTPDVPVKPDTPIVPGTGSFVAKPFSVSATKTVTFSPGNLQYHAANDEWRFAPSQTDYIGNDNENVSSTYNGWIDLFGWGTGDNPTNKSTDNYDYQTFVDWGVNKIGSYSPNTWRTLTYDEWYYLRYERPNYDKLIGIAEVNGVNGLVLLPDAWVCPNGVAFKAGFDYDWCTECYGNYQTISALEWSKLEASGAVFLPAAGSRYGSDVGYVQGGGYYWSATERNSYYALNLGFYSDAAFGDDSGRYDGLSVRLVQDDAEADKPITYTISFDANGGSGDMQSSELEENTTFTIPSNTFTHEGYEFTGWNTKADGTGTLYAVGAEINITSDITLYAQWEEKIYDGSFVAKPFSVSATKTITFSPGNLQYHAANDEWRFAPNQTDYIGEDNANISPTYNGWIDLFGWGTGDNPTNKSEDYEDYQTFVDWGVNKIGSYSPNTWRTLTYDEWYYLCYQRPNYDKLIGVAQVNGVNGLILLPDAWQCPSGVTFKSGFYSRYGEEYYATYQSFSASEWSKLEAAGAVFLPAAGDRYGSDVGGVQSYGGYWSATEDYSYSADDLYFFSDVAYMDYGVRDYGHSVRLVRYETNQEETPSSYTLSFDANGGSGSMSAVELKENESTKIPTNTFTRHGYRFIGWNTKADGTGTSYIEGQTISLTENTNLYAQWNERIYESSYVAKPFSVSATKTVTFSPGNLQYHAANDEWRFAPSQLDYIGGANENISSTYNGWIDLFGWGTGNNPINKSSDYDDYQTFVDWGVNKIGSYAPNTWRTLTYDEWYYLRWERPNYDKLIGVAQVNDVNGLILLPDDWTCPSGVTFNSGFAYDYGTEYYAAYQTFSSSEWAKLENSGAVFFPAAGYRDCDGDVYDVGSFGHYWSSTPNGSDDAYYLYFRSDEVDIYYGNRCYGRSVRLVQD